MSLVLRWAIVLLLLIGLLAGVHALIDSNFIAFLIVVLVYSLTLPWTRRFIYGPPPEDPGSDDDPAAGPRIDPRD